MSGLRERLSIIAKTSGLPSSDFDSNTFFRPSDQTLNVLGMTREQWRPTDVSEAGRILEELGLGNQARVWLSAFDRGDKQEMQSAVVAADAVPYRRVSDYALLVRAKQLMSYQIDDEMSDLGTGCFDIRGGGFWC